MQGNKIKTAKTISYEVWTNEGILQDRIPQKCNTVFIKVINLIQAYNTVDIKNNREVIQEEYILSIKNGKVDVSLTISALEDIIIERYYGLQTVNAAWGNSIHYVNGIHKSRVNIYRSSNNSGEKKDFPLVNRFVLKDKENYHQLIAWIDNEYGLGTFKYVTDNQPLTFTESYGKSILI